jgi:hypothetical protein
MRMMLLSPRPATADKQPRWLTQVCVALLSASTNPNPWMQRGAPTLAAAARLFAEAQKQPAAPHRFASGLCQLLLLLLLLLLRH